MARKSSSFDVAMITDGNSSIGMAHIMRSSAIADALQGMGQRVCFIVSDSVSEEKIRSLKFTVFCLNTEYYLLREQGQLIKNILKEQQVKFVFFDSYFASNELFVSVSEQSLVGCFGYGEKYFQGLNLIVPYGISSDPTWYDINFDSDKTTVLFGSRYIPLKRTFQNITPRDGSSNPKRLLLCTGSTDQLNITSTLIQAIRSRGIEIEIDVILGQFYDTEKVKLENKDYNNVQYHDGLEDLSSLMGSADIAISAGGLTLYELMASSVPTIAYAFVDNQLGNKLLDGAVKWCGDIRKHGSIDQEVVNKIIINLKELISCKKERMTIIANGRKVCDGMGAIRIARIIKNMNENFEKN